MALAISKYQHGLKNQRFLLCLLCAVQLVRCNALRLFSTM